MPNALDKATTPPILPTDAKFMMPTRIAELRRFFSENSKALSSQTAFAANDSFIESLTGATVNKKALLRGFSFPCYSRPVSLAFT